MLGLARDPTVRRVMHTAPATMNAPKAQPCLATGHIKRQPPASRAKPRDAAVQNPSNR